MLFRLRILGVLSDIAGRLDVYQSGGISRLFCFRFRFRFRFLPHTQRWLSALPACTLQIAIYLP